jgi:hypothetical protein
MQYSRFGLALRYANRSSYFKAALIPCFLVGLVVTPCVLLMFDIRQLTLCLVNQKAQATITQKTTLQWSRSKSHRLEYQFPVDGKKFNGSVDVPKQDWDNAQIGQALDVVFLPSDPLVNRSASDGGVKPISYWLFFISIAIAADVGCVLLLALGIRSLRRKLRLIAEGSPALAVIDCLDIHPGRKGRKYIGILGYEFQIQVNGVKNVQRKQLTWDIPYEIGEINLGQVVLVIYDPDDPDKSEIDRFGAREEDLLELQAAMKK